ncbi:MAG: hypothetical protein DMF79_19300, partial [Acidobacteria bacterium]
MGRITNETRADRRGAGLRAALALLVLVVSGSVSGDPAFDAGALRGLLQARGFSETQTQAALGMLERANARGLPAAALVNRAREGMARRAEPSAILDVLSGRLSNLERADDMARRCAREGITVRDREHSLLRLADSFSMGVAPGDVGSLLPAAARANRDLETVSRAAEVMGRLGRKGFPPRDTRDGRLPRSSTARRRPRQDESAPGPGDSREEGAGRPGRRHEEELVDTAVHPLVQPWFGQGRPGRRRLPGPRFGSKESGSARTSAPTPPPLNHPMTRALIVGSAEFGTRLEPTVLWADGVERALVSTAGGALEVARTFVPSVVVVDGADAPAALGLIRRLRENT